MTTVVTGVGAAEVALTAVGTLRWRTLGIEASSPQVQLARLPTVSGVGLLVRFPPGWSRPGHGTYDVAEEVLFLAGRFEMSGEVLGAGDHGWFPAGYLRAGSSSPTGALAWAWFSGPNRWQPEGEAAASTHVLPSAWVDRQEVEVPELGGCLARPLHRDDARESYVVDALPEPIAVDDGLRGIEVFDLATHAAAAAPTGTCLPAVLVGPAVVVLVR